MIYLAHWSLIDPFGFISPCACCGRTAVVSLKWVFKHLTWHFNGCAMLMWKAFNSKNRNQVADQRFSLKQWFSAGAHSWRLRKTGSAHFYLRISYWGGLTWQKQLCMVVWDSRLLWFWACAKWWPHRGAVRLCSASKLLLVSFSPDCTIACFVCRWLRLDISSSW